MLIIYLLVGFLIFNLVLFLICYFYIKKIKNELIGILVENSQDYLREFVNISHNKFSKLQNIVNLIKIKFNKLFDNYKKLNDNNSIIEKVINVIDYGILVLDKDNIICYINSTVATLFNIDNIENLFNKNIIDTPLNWILNFKDLNVFDIPNEYTSEDIVCYTFNITNDLKLYKFKNISDYKKFDYMSKEFISNITHELKTPLTSIIGFSETLKSVEEENDRQMFYDIINREAIRLNNLISDVLIFSEIDTNNDINKQKIDIIALLHSIKQLLQPQICKLNFEIRVLGDKILILNCEKYLRQIFINIIDNSIKHSFGTFIEIECSEDNENVFVKFSDNGIGIPNEELENIFNRFYKVLNSKSKGRGTGLGLSIVESCVRKINAKISVFNNDYGGITFKLEIPKK